MLETYAKVWKINKILLWDFLFLGPWRKSVHLTIQQPAFSSSLEALVLGSVLWETAPFYLSPRWWLVPVFKLLPDGKMRKISHKKQNYFLKFPCGGKHIRDYWHSPFPEPVPAVHFLDGNYCSRVVKKWSLGLRQLPGLTKYSSKIHIFHAGLEDV